MRPQRAEDWQGNFYRLALIASNGSPVLCGPKFAGLKDARDAATEFNAKRSVQGLKPCTHVALLEPRAKAERHPKRFGPGWRIGALYLLSGAGS